MILLTGANGFLGKKIYRALVEAGSIVRVVVRKDTEFSELPVSQKVISADLFLETKDWWLQNLDDVTHVIHAAWYTEPGKALIDKKNLTCLEGSIRLAEACLEKQVKRVVGVGTCFEYDLNYPLLSVHSPLRPTTLYAATKLATYLTWDAMFRQQNQSFAWCRPFYLYGEGEKPARLFPYLHQQLSASLPAQLSSGQQIRDYLEVTQAGKMIGQAVLSNQEGAINICSGLPVTVRQMAESIADEYGARHLLEFGARQDNLTDPPCVVGVCNLEEIQ